MSKEDEPDTDPPEPDSDDEAPLPGKVKRAHFKTAIDKILSYPEEMNEGFRVGAVGETGSGKTTFMKQVMFSALERGLVERAFIHDTKGLIPEVPESLQRENVGDFLAQGGFREGDPPMASFRGNLHKDVDCGVEEVAKLVNDAVRKGTRATDPNQRRIYKGHLAGVPDDWDILPMILYIDELAEAASGKSLKNWASPSTEAMFKKGRKIGGSVLWTTQNVKQSPSDACDQSSHIALFRSTSGARNYLRDRIEVEDVMLSHVEDFKNLSFVLWEKGHGWDYTEYVIPVSIFGKKDREANEDN